jgi:hypothetical protein
VAKRLGGTLTVRLAIFLATVVATLSVVLFAGVAGGAT